MNPYPSPDGERNVDSPSKRREPRAGWLVSVSLLLVILLEVLPTEAATLHSLAHGPDLQGFIAAKLAFLSAMCMPYFRATS